MDSAATQLEKSTFAGGCFWCMEHPAEEYHQHYYKKNPIRYRYYRTGCGRDRRLKELWPEGHNP